MVGLLCLPLTWGHASDGFEGAEEGLLVGEAGLYIDIGNLLVGILAQEALGVFDAVAVDELGEGTAVQGIDAVGNEAPVTAKGSGNIRHFQFAVLVKFLLFQQLIDAVHECLAGLRIDGDGFRLGLNGFRLVRFERGGAVLLSIIEEDCGYCYGCQYQERHHPKMVVALGYCGLLADVKQIDGIGGREVAVVE